jgi:hypothetical protein
MSAVTFSLSAQITYDTAFTRQWNSKTSEWENFDRILTSYEDGLVTSEWIQIKKENQWVNYNFKAYYYENGRVIEEFEQYWNDSKLRWEDNYRKLYSYDGEGKLMQITHQNIFKGKYINSSKEILIYTSDGKLQEKIIQKFSSKDSNTEKAWSNFLRYQYYYNSNDLLINENLAEWKSETWNNNYISYTYKYDDNSNLVEKTKVRINKEKGKNLLQETFVYDEKNMIKAHYVSDWDNRGKSWMNSHRAIYENNSAGNIGSMTIQQFGNEKWNNYISSDFSGINTLSKITEIADVMTFSIIGADYLNRPTLTFSNPYKESYYVSIHNSEGQIICSVVTNKNQISIDAMSLDRGLYFVELQGSNLYSGTFSIE